MRAALADRRENEHLTSYADCDSRHAPTPGPRSPHHGPTRFSSLELAMVLALIARRVHGWISFRPLHDYSPFAIFGVR